MALKRKRGSETFRSSTGTDSPSGGSSTGIMRGRVRAHRLVRHACIMVLLVLLIILGFYDSSLVKLVEYNRSDLLILGCEMLTEAGPRFQDSAKRHAEILRQYKSEMKQRNLAGVLASLPRYSKYSPEKGIDAALATLDSVDGNDIRENAVAVWKAGEQLMQFRGDTTRLFRRIGSYKPGRMSESLLEAIEDANDLSGEARAHFREKKSLLRAWRFCEYNRRTMLFLFLARSEGQCKEEVEQGFKLIAEDAAKDKRTWAAKTFKEGSSKRELVEIFADSEQRRCEILKAMPNDMDKARGLMWRAIEKAIQTRSTVLKIALELEPETRHWVKLAE